MGKLFGTDGIRGLAGDDLTCEVAFRVGQAAGLVLTETLCHKASFCIGKDTRISSDMLEAALVAGVTSVGADVVLLGVIPTPAVAFLAAGHADAGIMISASHNPFPYNGIKIFYSEGYKLSDEIEEKIESLVLGDGPLPVKKGAELGRVCTDFSLAECYVTHIAGCAEGGLSGIRVLFDCANGAASRTIYQLIEKLSIDADVIFDKPDGLNINAECGSTDMGELSRRVLEGGYDIGVAFDGDADRCLFVSDTGKLIDGDRILALCGLEEKQRGSLPGNKVVATVMSNLGFHLFLKENGMSADCAAVGDRNVLAHMRANGYVLGGEQSGHVIFLREATTGDGQLTAVKFLQLVLRSGQKVSELTERIPQLPQVLRNLDCGKADKNKLLEAPAVLSSIRRAEEILAGEGRVLVRASGTEALVRVMLEGRDEAQIQTLAEDIIQSIVDIM